MNLAIIVQFVLINFAKNVIIIIIYKAQIASNSVMKVVFIILSYFLIRLLWKRK